GTRRSANSVQPRAAQAVDGSAWHLQRQASEQAAHARNVAVVFARLVGTAVDHIGHSSPIDVGVAGHQCPQRYGAKVVGPYRRQGTTVAAEGGADGVTDKSLIHGSHVVCLSGLYRQANEVF